jgi:hypothetical protein
MQQLQSLEVLDHQFRRKLEIIRFDTEWSLTKVCSYVFYNGVIHIKTPELKISYGLPQS